MGDLLMAVLGRKHCGWCVLKDANWWERLTGLNDFGGRDSGPWYRRASIRLADFNTHTLPIWRLGEKWHYWRHA